MNAIEASNLRKTYPGGVRALDGLSFAVAAGTIFGLLGPNGAGKSTTVKVLTTLSRPDGGEARVAGLDVVRHPERVRRAIGVVGQKHGLDPEARSELWLEIARLAGDEGITVLLTTHYLEEADRLASRLAIVDRGRIVAAGTPDELKSELRGDTVQVELLETANGDATAALSAVSGISELSVDGRLLRARVDDGAAIPSLITALERGGLRVASATVARPSLDDVYLRHAGRSFQHADTETHETKEVAA